MTEIQNNIPINNIQTGTPLYTYAQTTPQQQTVSVTPQPGAQIYNYPQTSVYTTPNKQPASGVNIYIYNPSAIGGATANANYSIPGAQAPTPDANNTLHDAPVASSPIANTSISENREIINANGKKSTKVVELTDDYIKSLESYLKSPDKKVRQTGIKHLINRYEEDITRYNDPALTALLNIALLDPDAGNRIMAMSVISSGNAQGDETTVDLLKQCEQSTEFYGQEAIIANKALLATSAQRKPM